MTIDPPSQTEAKTPATRSVALDPQRPRAMLTVEEAAAELGIGRTTAFALVKSGELPSVKVGRLRRIPLTEIHAYTARLMADQQPTK